ncbi:MAG TPA: cation:proton antiporter [Candidatus Limnocylindria bacterium]|nr:cation:proton antiporter [Candidatus Limnocylindria bacterium]
MNSNSLAPWLNLPDIVFAILIVALFISFIRLAKGPSLPDRVVALDVITVIVAGILAVDTIDTGRAVFLDAAIVLALISFLGTVAFARYLERRARSE